ncbi:hypothetical protein F383_31914 [Gossypium arboreum]|uniref:Uncharacterized protein n=1 Tax=Gossypium arboreum TaxID=29729 RepID=A0A0B0PLC4_GOSAR|nr:hypothetical protein F383_31914 [Gossypium arboreum]
MRPCAVADSSPYGGWRPKISIFNAISTVNLFYLNGEREESVDDEGLTMV